jgi:hypothetical protein
VEFEKWKKVLFFGEDGIFFAKLAFSAVICGIRLHLQLEKKLFQREKK